MKEIIAIILYLLPSVGHDKAKEYASSYLSASAFYRMDVHIALVKTFYESGYSERAVSRTNDYGLLQLRVGPNTRPEYIGDEKSLFHVDTNIWLGTEALAYWRRHHQTTCLIWYRNDHSWVAHYKWGNIVPKGWKDKKFWRMYKKVKSLFRKTNATS